MEYHKFFNFCYFVTQDLLKYHSFDEQHPPSRKLSKLLDIHSLIDFVARHTYENCALEIP
jgi:hypothetical protein